MRIDDEFFKALHTNFNPESLIDDRIWKEWFDTLSRTEVFGKKVIHSAKSKQMVWPTFYSNETFGYYLEMKFSLVKESLGWKAIRTLLLCLADEYSLYLNNSKNSFKEEYFEKNVTNEVDESVLDKKTEIFEKELISALEIINNLTIKNKTFSELTVLLGNKIKNIINESNDLVDKKVSSENNVLHLKQLLGDLIDLSQSQIIDIDELNRQNKKLIQEVELYKLKYIDMQNRYEKTGMSVQEIGGQNIKWKKEEKPRKVMLSIDRESKNRPEVDGLHEGVHKTLLSEGGSSQPWEPYEKFEDIKI